MGRFGMKLDGMEGIRIERKGWGKGRKEKGNGMEEKGEESRGKRMGRE